MVPRQALFPQRISEILRSGQPLLLASAVLASLLNAGLSLLLIAQIQALIRQPPGDGQLLPLLGQFLLLLAAILLSHLWAGRSVSQLGATALLKLRQDTAQAIQNCPAAQLEALGPARLYAAFAEDLPRLGAVFSLLPGLLLNSVLSVAGLAWLGWLSWPHLMLCLAFLSVGLVFAEGVLARGIKRYAAQFRQRMDQLYHSIHALVHGYKELRLNPQRARQLQEEVLNPSLQGIFQAVRGRDDYSSAYSGWSLSLSLFLLCAVLLSAHWLLPMSSDTMVAYALVLLYLRGPVIAIINNLPHLIAGQVALNSLAALNLSPAQPPTRIGPVPPLNWQRLEWCQLSYRYPDGDSDYRFTLGPLNLSLERGQVLFITGGNGSGKSTLAKLLCGLYPPAGGTVLADGVAVESDRPAYRQLFSTVLGDYYLFPHCLMQGVAAEPEWWQHQLAAFGLNHKLQIRDGAWSQTQLSQGQRKRLALIQALAEERDILLLDEWAAEQDPEFRRHFYTELIPLWRAQGKTILAITHDDQYFHCADRIIALRQGQLVEHKLG